jgi:hypothetical protein
MFDSEYNEASKLEWSNPPLVSIITPTRNRARFTPWTRRFIESQDYPRIEWLIEDDSDFPDPLLSSFRQPWCSYRYASKLSTVGAKRNRLIARAAGEIIVHFDDDDYYAPTYVSTMVRPLVDGNAEFIKLTGFFVFDSRALQFFYWDQSVMPAFQFACKSGLPVTPLSFNALNAKQTFAHLLGFGFSYSYKREMWEAIPFPDQDHSEDLRVMEQAISSRRVLFQRDHAGLCFHLIHGNNLSACFPQFVLPRFMFDHYLPHAAEFIDSLVQPASPPRVDGLHDFAE